MKASAPYLENTLSEAEEVLAGYLADVDVKDSVQAMDQAVRKLAIGKIMAIKRQHF